MSIKSTSWFKFRIFIVLFFLMLSFMAIFARAFQLQVIRSPEFKERARKQHHKLVLLKPRRGIIYDRNMKEMAVDIEVESLYARPFQINMQDSVAEMLSPILGLSKGYLKRKIQSNPNFVWIKRHLDPVEVEKVKRLNIKGLGFIEEPKRFYPRPYLAAHTIGFSGVDSQGLEGIELKYNDYLRGEPIYVTIDRDALGSGIVLKDLDARATAKASNIVLTIDSTLQYIAEKELRNTVKRFNARGGMVIIMNPETGEVLAMANEPMFDPNFFQDFRPALWRNRAVTDIFEPGSTFKVFLVAAALEEGSISPDDVFFGENGSYQVYKTTVIHDYKKFGRLSVTDIIKYSSNIGAVKIGERLGEGNFSRYIQRLGFGSKTGIDSIGESRGLVRDVSNWSKVSLATMSFGQGISVTAIQLVTALSSIANGGYLMRPYIVKKIIREDGTVLKEFIPSIKRRIFSPATTSIMKRILTEVTKEDGTGKKASLPGYEIAGKTGTAQKVDLIKGGYKDGDYISSFMGFLPSDNPALSILVAIDEPQGSFYGGQVAAPLFREIVRQVLPYLEIVPSYNAPHLDIDVYEAHERGIDKPMIKKVDVSVDEKGNLFVPDFRGKSLRQVLRETKRLSLQLETVGSGRAVSQWPDVGTKLPLNDSMRVYFGEES